MPSLSPSPNIIPGLAGACARLLPPRAGTACCNLVENGDGICIDGICIDERRSPVLACVVRPMTDTPRLSSRVAGESASSLSSSSSHSSESLCAPSLPAPPPPMASTDIGAPSVAE